MPAAVSLRERHQRRSLGNRTQEESVHGAPIRLLFSWDISRLWAGVLGLYYDRLAQRRFCAL